jgi:hypothetical protein
MTSLVLERSPNAVAVRVSDDRIELELDDGRRLSVPLEWYPRLVHATPAERNHYELWGSGYAIEWPDLDEHLSVEALFAGRKSGECSASLERWLKSRDKRPS